MDDAPNRPRHRVEDHMNGQKEGWGIFIARFLLLVLFLDLMLRNLLSHIRCVIKIGAMRLDLSMQFQMVLVAERNEI